MNVDSFIYEINNINKELRRLRKQMNELDKRKKSLMEKIIEISKETGIFEFNYKGKVYKVEPQKQRSRKGEKKKKEEVITFLQREGYELRDAEEMYNKLIDKFQGEEKVVYKVRT